MLSATQILLGVLETLLITYGIVESKLFVRPRLLFEVMVLHKQLWLLQGFLHCPFCVGFWVALFVGIAHGAPLGLAMLDVPSAFILLIAFKRDLLRPSAEHEQELAQSIARSALTEKGE